MAGISNKTIAGVLLVSIAVSLVGTLISLSKLSAIGPARLTLTGGATANGSVTLNVSQSVSVNITQSTINFGSGYVGENSTATCNITTNGSFIPGGTSAQYCYCDMGTGNTTNASNATGTYSYPGSAANTGFNKNTTDPTSSEVLFASTGFCQEFLYNATATNATFIELENTGTVTWTALNVYGTDPDTWITGGTGDYPDEAFQGGCQNVAFTRAATGASVIGPYLINFNNVNNNAPGATCATTVSSDNTADRIRFEVFVRVPKDATLNGQTPGSLVFIVGG